MKSHWLNQKQQTGYFAVREIDFAKQKFEAKPYPKTTLFLICSAGDYGSKLFTYSIIKQRFTLCRRCY